MGKRLAALAVAFLCTALPESVLAGPLPPNTTIYIGVGVRDTGGMFGNSGTSSTFVCSNGSGVEVSIRFAIFHATGPLAGQFDINLLHARTVTVATRATAAFFDFATITPNTVLEQGTIVIEANHTGVFCSAYITDGAAPTPVGVPLRLLRLNPHPGVLE
jgi:hypothetical protein